METVVHTRDGQHDFDFLFARWHIRNRYLQQRLCGCDTWYEFDAQYTAQPLWDGKANLDQFIADSPMGRIEGSTLRLYDVQSGLWNLYWATAKNGLVSTPNTGAFQDDGTGDFFSNETFEGKPIVSRYRWTKNYGDGCRWEQAFSQDGGVTWETNWIMEFTRA